VARRDDMCDRGAKRESEERVPSIASAVGRSALPGRVASFGAFRLYATERVLKKNGTPLKIGSRALDILIVLGPVNTNEHI
jgi:hypothetical protein